MLKCYIFLEYRVYKLVQPLLNIERVRVHCTCIISLFLKLAQITWCNIFRNSHFVKWRAAKILCTENNLAMVFEHEDFDGIRGDNRESYLNPICFSGMLLLWVIYLPITVYYGFQFYQNRNFQVLKKRFSDIVVIEIILVITSFILNGGVILSDYLANEWLRNFCFYPAIIVQYSILYCWLWRFWLLFYVKSCYFKMVYRVV